MSQFDPNQFLDMTVTESNDTVLVPVPEGEFIAVADSVKVVPWAKKDGSAAGLKLQILWNIDDQSVKDELGRDKVTCRQDIMLDTNETGLDMGKGKNIGLGRLREAIGKNQPGSAFAFSQIPGTMCKVLIKHRLDDQNLAPDGSATRYSEVRGNAKI